MVANAKGQKVVHTGIGDAKIVRLSEIITNDNPENGLVDHSGFFRLVYRSEGFDSISTKVYFAFERKSGTNRYYLGDLPDSDDPELSVKGNRRVAVGFNYEPKR
jgi:hypothetical protein